MAEPKLVKPAEGSFPAIYEVNGGLYTEGEIRGGRYPHAPSSGGGVAGKPITRAPTNQNIFYGIDVSAPLDPQLQREAEVVEEKLAEADPDFYSQFSDEREARAFTIKVADYIHRHGGEFTSWSVADQANKTIDQINSDAEHAATWGSYGARSKVEVPPAPPEEQPQAGNMFKGTFFETPYEKIAAGVKAAGARVNLASEGVKFQAKSWLGNMGENVYNVSENVQEGFAKPFILPPSERKGTYNQTLGAYEEVVPVAPMIVQGTAKGGPGDATKLNVIGPGEDLISMSGSGEPLSPFGIKPGASLNWGLEQKTTTKYTSVAAYEGADLILGGVSGVISTPARIITLPAFAAQLVVNPYKRVESSIRSLETGLSTRPGYTIGMIGGSILGAKVVSDVVMPKVQARFARGPITGEEVVKISETQKGLSSGTGLGTYKRPMIGGGSAQSDVMADLKISEVPETYKLQFTLGNAYKKASLSMGEDIIYKFGYDKTGIPVKIVMDQTTGSLSNVVKTTGQASVSIPIKTGALETKILGFFGAKKEIGYVQDIKAFGVIEKTSAEPIFNFDVFSTKTKALVADVSSRNIQKGNYVLELSELGKTGERNIIGASIPVANKAGLFETETPAGTLTKFTGQSIASGKRLNAETSVIKVPAKAPGTGDAFKIATTGPVSTIAKSSTALGSIGAGMAANVFKSAPQIKNIPASAEVGVGLAAGIAGVSSAEKIKIGVKVSAPSASISISKSKSFSAVATRTEEKTATKGAESSSVSLGQVAMPTISQASARWPGLVLAVAPTQAMRVEERQVSRSALKLRALQRPKITTTAGFKGTGKLSVPGFGGIGSSRLKKSGFKFPKLGLKLKGKKRRYVAIPKPDLLSYHITALKFGQKGKELPPMMARSVFRKTSGMRVPTLQMVRGNKKKWLKL